MLHRVLERMVSLAIGAVCAGAALDVALVAMVAEGRLKSVLGLVGFALVCAATYWLMVPRGRSLGRARRRSARRV